jgi:hypothetical protein
MRYQIDRTQGEILAALDTLERLEITTEGQYETISSKITDIFRELEMDILALRMLEVTDGDRPSGQLVRLQEQARLNQLRFYDLEQLFMERSFEYRTVAERDHCPLLQHVMEVRV